MDREVFLAGLCLAALADFRTRRIPNWLSYSLVAIGLWGAVLCSFGWAVPPLWLAFPSISLGDSVAGLLACAAVLIVGWLNFGMGGADVKLAAGIGASLGLYPGLIAVGLGCLLAGLPALGVLLARSRLGHFLAIGLNSLGLSGLVQRCSARFSAGLKSEVPLGPFFALATIYVLGFGGLT